MLRQLWRLRLLVGLGVLLAAALAIVLTFNVSLSPFSVKRQQTVFGAAQTTIYLDTARSAIATSSNDVSKLTARAQVIGRVIDSGEVKGRIARSMSIVPNRVTVVGPFPDVAGQQTTQPAAQERANEILSQQGPFSIFVDTDPVAPTIALFVQANDGSEAVKLADATVRALTRVVDDLTSANRRRSLRALRDEIAVDERTDDRTVGAAEQRLREGAVVASEIRVRRLGQTLGGDVRDQTGAAITLVVFVLAAIAWCVGLLVLSAVIRTVRRR